MRDAAFGHRVEYRIDKRGRRTGGPCLAAAFDAECVGRARNIFRRDGEIRQIGGARRC